MQNSHAHIGDCFYQKHVFSRNFNVQENVMTTLILNGVPRNVRSGEKIALNIRCGRSLVSPTRERGATALRCS